MVTRAVWNFRNACRDGEVRNQRQIAITAGRTVISPCRLAHATAITRMLPAGNFNQFVISRRVCATKRVCGVATEWSTEEYRQKVIMFACHQTTHQCAANNQLNTTLVGRFRLQLHRLQVMGWQVR